MADTDVDNEVRRLTNFRFWREIAECEKSALVQKRILEGISKGAVCRRSAGQYRALPVDCHALQVQHFGVGVALSNHVASMLIEINTFVHPRMRGVELSRKIFCGWKRALACKEAFLFCHLLCSGGPRTDENDRLWSNASKNLTCSLWASANTPYSSALLRLASRQRRPA